MDTSFARKAFSLCRPRRGCFSCCPSRLRYCSTVVSLTLSFLPIAPLFYVFTHGVGHFCACVDYRLVGVFSRLLYNTTKTSDVCASVSPVSTGLKAPGCAERFSEGMDIMIGDLTASAAMTQSLTPAQIGSLLSQDSDEDLLGGAAAKKEREIIESNRVKLANYIHDVTTLFPLLRQEGIFSRDDVEIIEAPVTTTAKVDKFLDVLLRKGLCGKLHYFRMRVRSYPLLPTRVAMLYIAIRLGSCI